MKCSDCSHLSETNTSQTGRHCEASMMTGSPVSDFIIFNPDMFWCSMFTQRKKTISSQLSPMILKENHGRTKAASAR